LSIIFKKGIKLDGSHPTLLVGYGAYSITIDLFFSPRWLAWYERGEVIAVAHVRGGGEYGEEWHRAGMLQNKPNTWRDFIACAEYLVKSGYTSPGLAGQGGSAGVRMPEQLERGQREEMMSRRSTTSDSVWERMTPRVLPSGENS